jgi:hypothetical protein
MTSAHDLCEDRWLNLEGIGAGLLHCAPNGHCVHALRKTECWTRDHIDQVQRFPTGFTLP